MIKDRLSDPWCGSCKVLNHSNNPNFLHTSRALVEFLGLKNMLAIVCESTIAAETLGIPPWNGVLNNSQGLVGFAKNNKLKISGRYRVITLDDESRYNQLSLELHVCISKEYAIFYDL